MQGIEIEKKSSGISRSAYSSPELSYFQAFIWGHANIHREKYGVRNSMAQEITYDVKQ